MTARVPPVGPRGGPVRDRRGRGARGPLVLPGPLSRGWTAETPRDEFDDLVLQLVERLVRRWPTELADVEFGTEDVPELPSDWRDEPAPLGAVTPARPDAAARIVVFRRPVELRAKTVAEQSALVHEILVEHVAELLGRDPEDIDPPPR
jgi:Zincin-like metallopeptidase